jgi:DNA-binding transcriptional regulator YiaG
LRKKSILATERGVTPLVMTMMAGYQFPVPAAFSLRGQAKRFPGGLVGMLTLGWLSGDARARAVRDHWNSIPREARDEIAVEELCQAAGIEPGELVGIVARTVYNLGLDVSAIMSTSPKQPVTPKSRTLTCADMAALRKRLRLAARQFAQIFGVGLRTVQAWDGGECDPHPEHRVVVELVSRYMRYFGVETFCQRCVGESPRFAQRGRPPS